MAAVEHSSPEKAGSMDLKKADVEHSEKKVLTPEERQEALSAALAVDPGVNPRSWRAIQMYLIVLCICCCSGDSGFDGTVMGGVNSMAQYQQFFGLSSAGAKTGIVFGIYTVGSLVGAIPSGMLVFNYAYPFPIAERIPS
ncbi:hypothetical protein EWM64_g2448 [Hericium alpestre]|uniref:Major facilitator superfamily (MFS) profile domain-containing protein n=1 Tax=Hericium alpestre TaxID=135208 RepID=A0A4Z0A7F2_9AGAM|nr:hypothetical protein EWM64_g2448 [Hericium alpestre]